LDKSETITFNSKKFLKNRFTFAKRNKGVAYFVEEYSPVVGEEDVFLAFGEVQMKNLFEDKKIDFLIFCFRFK
jgi:cold shock CspA family protein